MYDVNEAVISRDGKYRYLLTRSWSLGGVVVFVMLNPSTADAKQDDPTIRKCVGFAKKWGYGGMAVVNLFALRATDPSELKKATNPIGPRNADYLRQACMQHDPADRPPLTADPSKRWDVVFAWGNHGAINGRGLEVAKWLFPAGVWCLGVNKSGQPRHPLMLPYKTRLVRFDDRKMKRLGG